MAVTKKSAIVEVLLDALEGFVTWKLGSSYPSINRELTTGSKKKFGSFFLVK
jgi:hypothetical protein